MTFKQWLTTMAPWLKNFTAAEVLTKCHKPLNHEPAEALWPNILPTLKVVQDLRTSMNVPITINSVYRSPAYNKSIGGVPNSQHLKFKACDISSPVATPKQIHAKLRTMRAAGKFKGGLGLYKTFVHVDTRSSGNADWKGAGVT